MVRMPPGVTMYVNKDGSKTYRIRWRERGSGPQQSHVYSRLAEAADALAKIKANGKVCDCQVHSPALVRPVSHEPRTPADGARRSTYTFGQAVVDYIAARTGIGKGYRRRFSTEMTRHFAPWLDRPVEEITDTDVKLWIRGCEDGEHPWLIRRVPGTANDYEPYPLSPTTIRRLLAQAGSAYAVATGRTYRTDNPFRGHRLGRGKDRSEIMRVLTPAEWALLESELPEGWVRDLARLLVGTGLRFSEATALRVGDVDLFARPPRLHVRHAWTDDGTGRMELGAPKSSRSRRVVLFGDNVVDALVPHVTAKKDYELVFTAPRGGVVRQGNFYHRHWAPAVRRAMERGLPRAPRIHDLRHTYASWQLMDGIALLTVSRRLGHETAAVTSDIYGDINPEAEEAAVAAVERAMTRGLGA
jgi:integrase